MGHCRPVLTVFASWLLLGEPLWLYQLGGLVLVIFGVARLRPKPRPPQPGAHPAPGRT